MRHKLPMKSTERNVHNNLVLYNKKEEISMPSESSTKARTILKIILIALSVAAGTAVCSTVVYFVLLKKNEEDESLSNTKKSNNSKEDSDKYIKTLEKNKIAYKCTDILANCNECKEITISRNLASRPLETNEEDEEDEGVLSSVVCTSCADNYYPIYNEDNIIIFCNKVCVTGEANFCKTCDAKNQNQCGTCNDGFYLPYYDMVKSKCKRCKETIDNCAECYSTNNNIICTKCETNFFLNTEKNICEPLCIPGDDNNCKTCNQETNKCDLCNSGYYLPIDDEEKKCKSCSEVIDKCEECYETKNGVKCKSCMLPYIGFLDENREIIICHPQVTSGPGERCKTCNYYHNKCISCNEGYYLPTDDPYQLKCKKCTDIVKNCNKCHGELYSVACEDYMTNYTETPRQCGRNCETGINEKCLTCNEDKSQCIECNEGYYLPTDDNIKLECKKCSNLIENCIACNGKTYLVTCTKCINDYILSYDEKKKINVCVSKNEIENTVAQETEKENNQNESIKPKCVTGGDEKCLTCDYIKNICSSCYDGYYLPSDDEEKLKCKKCSLEYCQNCEGTINSNICTLCLYGFTPIFENGEIIQCKPRCQIGTEGKCKTCHETEDLCTSCNVGYKLINGECILNYSFRATYLSETPYEKVFLINGFSNFIKLLIVDGEEVEITGMYHNFPEPKIHEVYVLINIPTTFSGYDSLFYNCQKLLSIHFTPLFNTSYVENMSMMFAQCYKLTSIDVTVFDTKKVVRMAKMFSNCKNLLSVDITHFNTTKLIDSSEMFSTCYSLTSIDLTNFYSPKLSTAAYMFGHCHSLTSIDFSNVKSLSLRNLNNIFDDCPKLQFLNMNNLYTDQVTTFAYMFRNCSSLTSLDFSIFSTSSLSNMDSMFEGCISLTSIDIWNFKTNKIGSSLRYVFKGCSNLKYINMASSTFNYQNDIYQGVPDGGTIIVHPTRISNAQKYLGSKGWNIVEATEYKE